MLLLQQPLLLSLIRVLSSFILYSLYSSHVVALYHRAMLLGGCNSNIALNENSSPEYVQLALACWHAEALRLQNVLDEQRKRLVASSWCHTQATRTESDIDRCIESVHDHRRLDVCANSISASKKDCLHGKTDCLDHVMTKATDALNNDSACSGGVCHVHQLEGKCGHKAILHKPENGPVHIDFVAGDVIKECNICRIKV
jgi:hypothetical protein